MGIALALIALGSWGLGDFLIQRSTRKFGDVVALFFITAFGALVLTPFIYRDLRTVFLTQDGLPVLLLASVVILIGSLLDFEALKIGKISIVESVYATELVVATALAAVVIGERLTPAQYALIGGVIIGILLVSTKSPSAWKKGLEKGVYYAFFSALFMGAANFMYGVGARETSPLLVNWFTCLFMAIVTLAALVWQSRVGDIARSWKSSKKLILGVSAFDNLAWVAFAGSMVYIPIGVAVSLSESYIALAALLGVMVNGERLKKHQWVGFAVCLASVIALALITEK